MELVWVNRHSIFLRATESYNYEVSLEHIAAVGLDAWLDHMRDKNWFSSEHERQAAAKLENLFRRPREVFR